MSIYKKRPIEAKFSVSQNLMDWCLKTGPNVSQRCLPTCHIPTDLVLMMVSPLPLRCWTYRCAQCQDLWDAGNRKDPQLHAMQALHQPSSTPSPALTLWSCKNTLKSFCHLPKLTNGNWQDPHREPGCRWHHWAQHTGTLLLMEEPIVLFSWVQWNQFNHHVYFPRKFYLSFHLGSLVLKKFLAVQVDDLSL